MTAPETKNLRSIFAQVREWVFDLDNTLYPHHCDLFAQIDQKMTDYVSDFLNLDRDQARKTQKELFLEHGTTLRGLMNLHDADAEDFLRKVHDIDYAPVSPNPALAQTIKALPGRKHVFTNAGTGHARRVLERLQCEDCFDGIFDIVAADMVPKPEERAYRKFFETCGVNPKRAAMFEDMPQNLDAPREAGMKTVLIVPRQSAQSREEKVREDESRKSGTREKKARERRDWEKENWARKGKHPPDFVTDDLSDFLEKVLAAIQTA